MEKVRREKMQEREKAGKSQNTLFLKKCTPLWREAHLESIMYKTLQVRSTFGQMVTEKIDMVDDPACHHTLLQVYQFLMQKEDRS